MSKRRKQPGFFDVADRLAKLGEKCEPLLRSNALVDWEAFRAELLRVHEKERKSNAGAKPFDVVLMFKILVLQQLHNLSDEGIEYQIRDRFSFMRFLGLELEDVVPDAKTIWLFREQTKEIGLMAKLFSRFHEQLAQHSYVAKAGETPEDWQAPAATAKKRQKDVDARWTKKNNETHYGYKNHINADEANKLVQSYGSPMPRCMTARCLKNCWIRLRTTTATSVPSMQTAPIGQKRRKHNSPKIGFPARFVRKANGIIL